MTTTSCSWSRCSRRSLVNASLDARSTQKPHGEPPTGPTHASTGDRSFFERRNESGLVELVCVFACATKSAQRLPSRTVPYLTGLSRQNGVWAHPDDWLAHPHAHPTQLPTPGKEFYFGVPRRSTDGVPVNAAPLSRHGHSLKRIPRKIFFFKRGRGVHAGERVPAHSQRGRGGGRSQTGGERNNGV